MSDSPRRRPVPVITPQRFDDERPTPVTSTRTATATASAAAMDPEPPTIPAISITAPSFAEAAKVGPPRPRREREGDAVTVAERVSPPPGPLPPPAAPGRARREGTARPTEAEVDPWEYRTDAADQAASLASGYEGGGVELDPSGRLVAPGLRSPRKPDESNPGVSPADLLSVALEVWPDAPPPRPAAPLPSVEPVVRHVEPVFEAPPDEPPTNPRPPPQRRPTPRAAGPKRSSIATADTVLRAPRARQEEDISEAEGWFDGPAQDEPAQDGEEPDGEAPAEEPGYGEEPIDEEVSARRMIPEEPTRVKGTALDQPDALDEADGLDEPTERRRRPRGSRRSSALLRLLFLGVAGAAAWLWYTGRWSTFLADLLPR